MAKDPAFLFYPGDFSTGTQFFTDEQVGKYIRLLMAQHQHGHLTEKHMIQICKSYDNDVFSKFEKDDAGCYYNQRLENEVIKRKKYSESRAKNRKSEKNISESYVYHMENKDIDIDKKSIIEIYFDDLPNSKAMTYISKDLSIPIPDLVKKLPEFRKAKKTHYKDFHDFANHFKFWFIKSGFSEKPKPYVQTLKNKPLLNLNLPTDDRS